MFSDNDIAKQFSCSATICAYLVCFGLAPFFKESLTESIRRCQFYSVSFDECLNKVSQNSQVDLVIPYFENNAGKVMMQYLGSEFLGHTTSADLLVKFKDGVRQLNPRCLIQISMDGPNVNWKFLEDLKEHREEEDQTLPDLINLGSCDLHSVHGSLQHGANETGWR